MFPRDLEALKVKDPSRPRGRGVSLSLKEARGVLFKCGERLESSLEMLQCMRIARGGVKALSVLK